MKEQDKTKKQLISELEEMHQQVTALEAIELDRSQAKEQLAKSEVKYRRLFETAQDGILILDADTGTIVDVNPFLVDMLGYSKEEFLGKKIWEVGAFKNIEASKTAFAKLQSEHYIRYEDMPLEAKNGKLINVEFVSNVYDVDQTRVIQCNIRDITVRKRVEEELLVCRNKLEEKVEKRTFELEKTTTKLQEDITERKKVEGNLAPSEELLRAFTEVLPDLAFILDENGRYIDILVRKANLLYQEASKTIGQTLHDILPKEVADLNLEAIQKVIKTGEMQTIEYHLDVPAGTRYFEARLSPMRQYERGLNMVAAIIRDITEEKHAKDELLQEKNFITSVIDTAQTIILILDKQGRISRFNPYMEQISGYRLDEVLGKDWFNTFLPEPTRASTRKQFGQSINDIQTRGNVDKIVTKDGSELDIEWSAKTMKDASGNTVGLIAVGQDITERKQVEAALREAEFQYRTVADFTYDWEYWENPDGTYRYVSPSCDRISGYKADEFISNPDLLFEIIIPEDKEIWLQHLRQRAKKHRKNEVQFCIQRKDGEMCWIEHASQLVFDDQGKFLGYRASNRDITERRKAEEILRESEGRFRTLFESTVEGILIADVETKKQQYANPAICTLLGYSKEELTKMSVEDIHPKDSLEYVLAEFDAQARGEKKIAVLPCLKKNGTIFYADINTTKAIIDGRECNIGFFTDVTEHRLAQQELQKLDKLESVGTLAGGIAHDFNNLLTGIMGNISLAKRYVEPKGKAFERLDEAEKASLRARDLTQQLLTFARGGAPIKKTVSITQVIKESAVFSLSGATVRPEFSLADDLWMVKIDEGQMSQVIRNIVINADEAMPNGGTIKIRAQNRVIKKAEALPLPSGNYIQISIADQGIGIPKEHLPRIFDPYFSTKKKGSGLGLATSYSIIKNHGGHITVESTMGVGTIFRVYLPALKKRSLKRKEEKEQPAPIGQGRILVMDDEKTVREFLHAGLTDVGYDVELTSDGKEAITRYAEAKAAGQPFAAVILDLTIPGGMGGMETIKKLLELDPNINAIVSSGYATDPIMSNYKKYGFSAVVTKPYSVEELEKILHNLLGKKK